MFVLNHNLFASDSWEVISRISSVYPGVYPKINSTFDGTQNSPYKLNKTLCFVCLVRFIFTLQPFSENSQKLLHNKSSSQVKKIVTSSSHLFIPYLVLRINSTLPRVGLVKTVTTRPTYLKCNFLYCGKKV